MAEFPKNRMAVLPYAKPVPRLADLEHKFQSFWQDMRRNIHGVGRRTTLDFSEQRRAKSLAEAAHERRLREAGFKSVNDKELPAVLSLANDGGCLRGPATEDDVHRLAAALHAESPWMRDVSAWIMAQLLSHVRSGGHGLALPPVILAGPPGVGKSHYARKLASLANVPVRMIDVGGGTAGFRISGTEKGWGTAQAGIPVETILATKVANPIMVVDEIDKAGTAYRTSGASTSLTTSMLQMLEPGTARHFECAYLRVPLDMSRLVWIMTANEIERVPAPLRDRARIFILPKLTAKDAIAHFDRLTAGHDDRMLADRCHSFIANMCAQPGGISLRQIQQLAGAVQAPMQRVLH